MCSFMFCLYYFKYWHLKAVPPLEYQLSQYGDRAVRRFYWSKNFYRWFLVQNIKNDSHSNL